MPEGFEKVSDLKIVISAATQPLQEGIASAQGLIRGFTSDANSGLGKLDAMLGTVGVGAGALASRLNVVVGAVATAGEVFRQAASLAEQIADKAGASAEFDAVKTSAGEVQSALLELAGIAFTQLQQEATSAAYSLAGFDAAATQSADNSENVAQRVLKSTKTWLDDLAHSVRALAPEDMQSYDTLARSLEKLDAKIKDIEESSKSGSKEAESWTEQLTSLIQAYAEWERYGTGSTEDTLDLLKEQRNQLASIVELQAQRWDATIQTPEADKYLGGIEREVRMLEQKAAALNMTAAAAATYIMREKVRQELEGQSFALAPDGDKRLDGLMQRYADAQRKLEADQEAKRQKGLSFRQDQVAGNVINGLERALADEQRRARTVGMSADEVQRLTAEENALLTIRQAGREATGPEEIKIRALAAARQMEAKATAEQVESLRMLQAHAAIAGRTLERAFGNWIDGTKNSWQDLVSTMLEDMAKLAFREGVANPLMNGATSAISGLLGTGKSESSSSGGMLGSVLGDIFGSIFGGGSTGGWQTTVTSDFGGFRADGGDVAPGLSYIVGERGPEVFLPKVAGSIVPNGGSGGRASPTIHVVTNVDARGATADAIADLKRELALRDAQLPSRVLSVVGDASERGIL